MSADYSNTLPSPGYGTSSISFGSSPENAEKLTAAVLTEVKRLAAEGPTAEDAAKVREQEKRELETGAEAERLLARRPADAAHRWGATRRCSPQAATASTTITPERLKAAFQKVLPDEPLHGRDAVAGPEAGSPRPCGSASAPPQRHEDPY